MNKLIGFYLILPLLFLTGCGNDNSIIKNTEQDVDDNNVLTLTAKTNVKHQTIYGFGASDAWSIQFVGKNWPVNKRKRIADLLFSTEFDSEGNPKGIGLSVWRFNIGAGSKRQGKKSGIANSWRRSGSFLTVDSTYEWSRHSGQQWFMKAAKERGVQRFIGFANSPPVLLTKNGKAYGAGGGSANIAPQYYDEYADYLAKIANYFKSIGIPLDYISPVNEPQWNWSKSNGQEGSPWQNSEIVKLVKALDKKIKYYGLRSNILIPEAGEITFLYNGDIEGRSNQAAYFFGSDSKIKRLSSVPNVIAAHSYFTTWPVREMIEMRQKLWEHLQSVGPNLKYWVTEYCVLISNDKIQGNGRDLGIKPALYIARVMHYDLTVANASSWQWWLAVSANDYKDGLVYIDRNKQNGEVYESKMLWAVGNYSRFIRPGAVRLTVNRSDSLTPYATYDNLMASAYLLKDKQKVVFITINYSYKDRKVRLNVNGLTASNLSKFTSFITSSKYDLSHQFTVNLGDTAVIPERSIVTLVATYNN